MYTYKTSYYIKLISALVCTCMPYSRASDGGIPALELITHANSGLNSPDNSIIINNLVAYIRASPHGLMYLRTEQQQLVVPLLTLPELIKIASFSDEYEILIRRLHTHTITTLDLSRFKGFTKSHLKLIHDLFPNLLELVIHVESLDIKWYLDAPDEELASTIKHIFAYVPSVTIYKNRINPHSFLKN